MNKIVSLVIALALAVTMLGLGATSASAHTPSVKADCNGLVVKATSYSSDARVKVTIDGKVVEDTAFNSNFSKTYSVPQDGEAVSYTVSFDERKDGNQYDKTFTGNVGPCGEEKKTDLCHATGSDTNPFVKINVSVSAAYNGHLGDGHQNGEDIIPPFIYKGQTYSQNWDAEGQAIFNNGCVKPVKPIENPGTIVANCDSGVTTSIVGIPEGVRTKFSITVNGVTSTDETRGAGTFNVPVAKDDTTVYAWTATVDVLDSRYKDKTESGTFGPCAKPVTPPVTPPTPPVCDDECKIPFVKNKAPKVTKCSGVIVDRVLNNVRVPANKSCTLVRSHVNGSVTTAYGARNLTLADVTVRKNITAKGLTGDFVFGALGNACRYDPFVGGTLSVIDSHNVLICQASVCEKVEVRGNDGRITIRDTSARYVAVQNNRKFVSDSAKLRPGQRIIRLVNVDGKKAVTGNAPRKVKIYS